MEVTFWELFFVAFLISALLYSFLASWTRLLYRGKSWGQLSANELKVKQGTATIENRIDLFVRTFFLSLFTYQIYLVALLLGSIVYFGARWFLS